MAEITAPRETAARIAGWIVGSRFGPGDTLPIEAAIGQELSVSRTAVREAMKSLTAKGIVLTGPRVGSRVRPMSDWNLFDPDVLAWRVAAGVDDAFVRDLLELRLAIEPMAARLAAVEADEGDLAAIRDGYAAMAEAVAGRGNYLSADLSFHQAVLRATHNQFVAAMVPAFSALLRVSFQLSVKSRASAAASLPAHKRLHDAIARHNPRAAELANAKIIAMARADIVADIGTEDEPLRGRRR